jgi:hypothetical protein
MRGADCSNDDVGNEVLGALCGKGEVEVLDEQKVDAEASQLALFDTQWRQPERLRPREEHLARMRLERQHTGRSLFRLRELARPAEQHGMPAVEAVEIADREDGATRVV